jgi:Ca-activated chloride channel family protein
MIRAALAVALASIALPSATGAQPQPSFRSGVQTVAIHATVKDKSGRLVSNLTKEQFQVFDNGQPVEITTFSSDVQPLTVALLLDMSGSMSSRVLLVRESTLRFIDALLPHDRVRICTFGSEIAISPLLTGDKTILTRIVRDELWPGGGTPLWNAMFAAMGSLAQEPGRRVILVLTDGMDGGALPGMRHGFGDVRERATANGFMIYAIGMEGLAESGDAREKFDALIADTGGGRFQVGRDDDLRATFGQVAEELRRQYLIGFSPAASDRADRPRSLDIRVTEPGMQVRARKSYVPGRQ